MDIKHFRNDGKLKLLIIVGTRPEIIRLAAVINKCREYFDCLLAHTGQNYDYNLNGVFFKDLKLADPDVYMDAVGDDLGATMGNIIDKSYKLMVQTKPDAVLVLGPDGAPVAMVHCNNCTSDINAWVNLFSEFSTLMGVSFSKGDLFTKLFQVAAEGDPDCGGLMSYNYFSGEGVTDLDEGRPVFARTPDASFTIANFMRTHLYSALATLKIGMDILQSEEQVKIDKLLGHGGFFKTPEVGQRMLSAAVNAPVSVMKTAGEGGPYGMALLAAYMLNKEEGETLPDYLDNKVFADAECSTIMADSADVEGFAKFLASYVKALPVEKTATEVLG